MISRIESGQHRTSTATLRRLAEALDGHAVIGFEFGSGSPLSDRTPVTHIQGTRRLYELLAAEPRLDAPDGGQQGPRRARRRRPVWRSGTRCRGRWTTRGGGTRAKQVNVGNGVSSVACGQIGGIPVFWQEAPGPLMAALGFRVGRADEPLARSGLTHLVEHLALSGRGPTLSDVNGWVNGTTTWFGHRGPADELNDFLGHLRDRLVDLPVDRLAAELRVLQAEDARHERSVAGRCLAHWFATLGWGTVESPEYGLSQVTAEQAQAWSARWFGAGNAVVWMTGPPTDGIDAALALPSVACSGEPTARVLADRVQPASWRTHRQPVTAMSYLAPRTDDTTRAAIILRGRLRHLLRDRDGTSYHVSLHVQALDAETAHVLVTADGPAPAVLAGMEEALEAISQHGPTSQELAHQRAAGLRAEEDPASLPGRLAGLAHARLCDWPAPVLDPFPLDDTTAGTVSRLVAAAAANTLFLVPAGTAVPNSLAVAGADPQRPVFSGRTFRPLRPQHGQPPCRPTSWCRCQPRRRPDGGPPSWPRRRGHPCWSLEA